VSFRVVEAAMWKSEARTPEKTLCHGADRAGAHAGLPDGPIPDSGGAGHHARGAAAKPTELRGLDSPLRGLDSLLDAPAGPALERDSPDG
jgi:hypothetical protein